MKKILIVHGPNLNLLGEREPEIYGSMTLKDIDREIKLVARNLGATTRHFQSNHEGELLDFIQKNRKWADGMVINPAAYTHTSVALRDCIAAMPFPTIEVHLSDIKTREKFRQRSWVKDVCVKQISGLGWKSYTEGLKGILNVRPSRAKK